MDQALPRAKTNVGRADLLRFVVSHGEGALAVAASTLGYERMPPAPDLESEFFGDVEVVVGQPSPGAIAPETPSIERPANLPTENFFYVSQREMLDASAQRAQTDAPAWFEHAEVLDEDARPEPTSVQLPERPQLTRWSRLWPFLRRELAQEHVSSEPDITRVIAKLTRGEVLSRIPKRTRRGWNPRICIVIDYNRRTEPFWDDFNHLRAALERMHGALGLDVRILTGEMGPHVFFRRPRIEDTYPWRMPAIASAVLILSDLGMHGDDVEMSSAWRNFGKRLKAAECDAVVLAPVPLISSTNSFAASFESIHGTVTARYIKAMSERSPPKGVTAQPRNY